jgi:hypothetical protein
MSKADELDVMSGVDFCAMCCDLAIHIYRAQRKWFGEERTWSELTPEERARRVERAARIITLKPVYLSREVLQ